MLWMQLMPLQSEYPITNNGVVHRLRKTAHDPMRQLMIRSSKKTIYETLGRDPVHLFLRAWPQV